MYNYILYFIANRLVFSHTGPPAFIHPLLQRGGVPPLDSVLHRELYSIWFSKQIFKNEARQCGGGEQRWAYERLWIGV